MTRLHAHLAAAFAGAMAMVGVAQTSGTPERYTAMAVNMNRGGSGTVDIAVTRWSTETERTRLVSTLMDEGPQKLLDLLQSYPRVGYIRFNSGLGYDLHFSEKNELPDGGERVVLATDRPIGFWEAANQPRTIDYPFTIIELHLNSDGAGEGKLSVATKIIGNKDTNTVILENYDIQPVLLQSVRRVKASQQPR
jgi:hypothetical protein